MRRKVLARLLQAVLCSAFVLSSSGASAQECGSDATEPVSSSSVSAPVSSGHSGHWGRNPTQGEIASIAGSHSVLDFARGYQGGTSLQSWSEPWSISFRNLAARILEREVDRTRPTPTSETNSDPHNDLNPVSCQGVVVSSGELTLRENDIVGFGLRSLTLDREYRSASTNGSDRL
jgi:hypothetical protein